MGSESKPLHLNVELNINVLMFLIKVNQEENIRHFLTLFFALFSSETKKVTQVPMVTCPPKSVSSMFRFL